MAEVVILDGSPSETFDEIAAANSAAMEEMMKEPPIRALLTSDAPAFVAREIELTPGQLAIIENPIGEWIGGAVCHLEPDADVRFHAGLLLEVIEKAQNAGFVVEPATLITVLNHLSVSATGRAG